MGKGGLAGAGKGESGKGRRGKGGPCWSLPRWPQA